LLILRISKCFYQCYQNQSILKVKSEFEVDLLMNSHSFCSENKSVSWLRFASPAVTTGAVCSDTKTHLLRAAGSITSSTEIYISVQMVCRRSGTCSESLFTALCVRAVRASQSSSSSSLFGIKEILLLRRIVLLSPVAPKAILSGLSKRENVIKCAQRERSTRRGLGDELFS